MLAGCAGRGGKWPGPVSAGVWPALYFKVQLARWWDKHAALLSPGY